LGESFSYNSTGNDSNLLLMIIFVFPLCCHKCCCETATNCHKPTLSDKTYFCAKRTSAVRNYQTDIRFAARSYRSKCDVFLSPVKSSKRVDNIDVAAAIR